MPRLRFDLAGRPSMITTTPSCHRHRRVVVEEEGLALAAAAA